MSLTLAGVEGSNPLGFLASLGLLAVGARMLTDADPRLAWTDELVPVPVLHGDVSERQLVDAVMKDRDLWEPSACLDYPPGSPADDVKFRQPQLRAWIEACAEAASSDGGRALGLVTGLVAEGALTRGGEAKPTDLHFTAGQQKFLKMARQLRDQLTAEHVEEALFGPWRYDGKLPSFKWDITDDRTYALSAVDPAGQAKPSVPGAEWLALLGLSFLPVARRPGRTRTTGCGGSWSDGHFTWPVWGDPLDAAAVQLLLSLRELTLSRRDLTTDRVADTLGARGARLVFRSIITRSDQGGYGSFRPPLVVLDVAGR